MAHRQDYLYEVTGRLQHQMESKRKRMERFASSLAESVDRGETLGLLLHPKHHGIETRVLFF